MTYAAYSYLDNNIGPEGACALAESLKQNTALINLILTSMLELHELLFVAAPWDISRPIRAYSYLGNKIGAEGAYALAKSLKQNITLTQLDLGCKCMTVLNVNDLIPADLCIFI